MSTECTVDILILGGGVTGLGAATRLTELQHPDWLLIEADQQLGGLACTDVTAEGFLFDRAVHVVFSHYDYFDQVLDYCVGTGDDDWCHHKREIFISSYSRKIPYPFQLNIHRLPPKILQICLEGLFETKTLRNLGFHDKPKNYGEWIQQVLGKGIAEVFLDPYSYKMWGTPSEKMSAKWVGERVATVDTSRVLQNIIESKDDLGWGPTAKFRIPKYGGNATNWKSVSKFLPKDKLQVESRVTSVNLKAKKVKLQNGNIICYNKLLTTAPLELFLGMSEATDFAEKSKLLSHSSTHVVGLGLRGAHNMGRFKIGYFPQRDIIFHRVTLYSGLSPYYCPSKEQKLPTLHIAKDYPNKYENGGRKPGPYWSLLFEVTESKDKQIDTERIVEGCVRGCVKANLFEEDAEIVSVHYLRLEHGYPIPTLERDEVVGEILEYLKEQSVWSRGRFGSYKYEVSNQDHSFMLGVEAVDNMLTGQEELTLNQPDYVNQKPGPNCSRLNFSGFVENGMNCIVNGF